MSDDHDLMSIFHKTQSQGDVRLDITTRTDRAADARVSENKPEQVGRERLQKSKSPWLDFPSRVTRIDHRGQMRDGFVGNGQLH
jgi:hypothetical protein